MIAVKVQDLKEGMIPAKDVKDRDGRLILASGNNITTKHIKTFKAWGVTEVSVSDGSEDGRGSFPGQIVEPIKIPREIQDEMGELFRYVDRDHPAMRELYDLCLTRKLGFPEEEKKTNEA
jgi:hypothetical protein